MSMETLRKDLTANLTAVAAIKSELASPEVVANMVKEMWAFMENLVDELDEIDGSVADLYSEADDILQPETAAVFSALVLGAGPIAAALKTRLDPSKTEDQVFLKMCDEHIKNAQEAEALLQEIVVDVGDDGDDGDGEGDDDDDKDEE